MTLLRRMIKLPRTLIKLPRTLIKLPRTQILKQVNKFVPHVCHIFFIVYRDPSLVNLFALSFFFFLTLPHSLVLYWIFHTDQSNNPNDTSSADDKGGESGTHYDSCSPTSPYSSQELFSQVIEGTLICTFCTSAKKSPIHTYSTPIFIHFNFRRPQVWRQ